MRRRSWVAVVGVVLVFVFAGVALAKTIGCDAGRVRCVGTPRADTIFDSEGRHVIFALGGFDEVQGFSGENEIHGGDGGDDLFGGDDKDTIYGGAAGDALIDPCDGTVGCGGDVLNGGKGGDLMFAGHGDDILRGEDGSDTIGRQTTAISGGPGDDALRGGKGDDHLDGDAGKDRHYGGPGDDLIDLVEGEQIRGLDERDFVDCGDGKDEAVVGQRDRVLSNCEDVSREPISSAAISEDAEAAAEIERQQALERFRAEREAER